MPYITEERKQALNPFLAQVSDRISSREELAYCMVMLACREIRSVSYPEIASIYGDIHVVAQEYWRRVVAPYQQGLARKMGDIFITTAEQENHEEAKQGPQT